MLGWLEYCEYVRSRLLEAVEFLGRPTLTVFYEDFLANPLEQAARAAAFVGAASAGLRPPTRFQKAGPDDLQLAVANFGVG